MSLEERISLETLQSGHVVLKRPDTRLLESEGKFFISHAPSYSIIPLDEVLAKFIISGETSEYNLPEIIPKIQQLLNFNAVLVSDQHQDINIINCVKPPIKTLIFHVTKDCNLLCKHCYINAGGGDVNSLDGKIIHDTIVDFANMGGLIIEITGGEPLLRENIFYILSTAKNSGLHTNLLSNGTNISKDIVKKIKEAVHKITISIDGLGKVHDWVRGDGVFEEVQRSMNYLKEEDVPLGATTMFTYKNLGQLEDIQKFLIGRNVKYWSLVLPRNSGRFKEDDTSDQTCREWFSNIDKYYIVLSRIKQRAKDNNMEVIIDHVMVPYQDRKEIRVDPDSLNHLLYNKGRICWDNTITVLSNGDVKGCLFIDNFVYGNLKSASLRTIYNSIERKNTIDRFKEFKGTQECPIIPIPSYA